MSRTGLPDFTDGERLSPADRDRIAAEIDRLIGLLDSADAPFQDREPEEDADTGDDEPDADGEPMCCGLAVEARIARLGAFDDEPNGDHEPNTGDDEPDTRDMSCDWGEAIDQRDPWRGS